MRSLSAQTRLQRTLITLLLLLLLSPLSLTLLTRTGLAPLRLRVGITIPSHPDNRAVTLAWDTSDGSGHGAGSSSWEVAGGEAPEHYSKDLTLSSGEWILVATLTRVTGGKVQQFTTQGEVEVR